MDILKKLTQTYGPSGREEKIRQVIEEYAAPYADEIYTDALGNLIVRKKGNGKKIMVAAHMDEIGVVATLIDENGFIRFSSVGGLYNKDLLARRVCFENGVVGIIGSEEENKEHKILKMYIDIGARDKKSCEELVSVGDMAVFCGDYYENDNCVISKALDNRSGCYALLKVLEGIKSKNDLYFVFTSQEEVGLRGARTSAFSISPDYALAIDVTDTGDTPNGIKMATKLSDGAAIKIMDRSILCDSFVRSKLAELAAKSDIPYQLEVMNYGGTDAGAISLSGSGVKTGGISIPTRYIHSPSEMIKKEDLKAVIALLSAFLEESHE